MLAFASVIRSQPLYDRHARPSLLAHAEPDAVLIEAESEQSLFEAHNEILDTVAGLEGIEALVLMSESAEIVDPRLNEKIRAALRDHPDTAIFGVVGARDVVGPSWWQGQALGSLRDVRAQLGFAEGQELDAAGGILMVLSPWAIRQLRHDAAAYPPAFHGADVELCFLARAQGKKVRVLDLDVLHRASEDLGDEQARSRVEEVFCRRWIGPDSTASVPAEARVPSGSCLACGAELPPNVAVAARRVVACPGCGLGHSLCLPESAPGEYIWDVQYGGGRLERRDQWLEEARRRVAWIREDVPTGTIVELGCATGEFLEVSHSEGYDVIGIETSLWAANIARELGVGEIATTTIGEWRRARPTTAVDAVCLFHVLEHIDDPRGFLHEVRSAVAPGTSLYIEVPNFASPAAQRNFVRWVATALDEHVAHYTPEALRRILAATGFNVLDVHEFDYSAYADPQYWQHLLAQWRRDGFDEYPRDLLRARAVAR